MQEPIRPTRGPAAAQPVAPDKRPTARDQAEQARIERANAADTFEISDEARALIEAEAPEPPDLGTLQSARIRQIIVRVTRDSYSNPRVQRELVLYLSRDIFSKMNEG